MLSQDEDIFWIVLEYLKSGFKRQKNIKKTSESLQMQLPLGFDPIVMRQRDVIRVKVVNSLGEIHCRSRVVAFTLLEHKT